MNPINQQSTQPVIYEANNDKSWMEMRHSRFNSLEDSAENSGNFLSQNSTGLSNLSGFHNNDFMAMLQNSMFSLAPRPESQNDFQHTINSENKFSDNTSDHIQNNSNNRPAFDDIISSSPERSQNPAPEKFTEYKVKNQDNITERQANDAFEKNERNGKIGNHAVVKKQENFLEKNFEGKIKTSNLSTDKISLENGFNKTQKTGQAEFAHRNFEKNPKPELENNKTWNQKDSREILVKDIKKSFSKTNAFQTTALNGALDNVANEKNHLKNNITLSKNLPLKNTLHQVKDGKNIFETDKLTKADKIARAANLKALNLEHKKSESISNAIGESLKNADQVVSRETISMTALDSKLCNKQSANQNDYLASKEMHTDKAIIADTLKSNLKSNLDSETSSGQQHGYSTHSAERFNFMSKIEDNLALRNNLQQQIDQMLQRAKVIIRDNGNAQLSTKLNPKELGEISIKLSLVNGKLTGKFTVDNDFVQKELNGKLDKIFADLKTEGYVVDAFQVDVKSESGQKNQDNSFNETMLNLTNQEFNGFRLNSKQETRISDLNSIDFENSENNFKGEIYA